MTRAHAALMAMFVSAAAQAQPLIANGDFEGGSLAPWVVTPTSGGVSIGTGLGGYDVDGPAPYPPSVAARFLVGKTGPAVPGSEGVEITQSVQLVAGQTYTLWVQWAVKTWVSVHNQTGGQFDLIAGGQVIDTSIAPPTTGLTSSYGWLRGTFTPAASGQHDVGVRITRPVVAGEEVFQYLDRFGMVDCLADCNQDNVPTITDLPCFQNLFVFNHPYADLNNSGTFTIADFGTMRTVFVQGCP